MKCTTTSIWNSFVSYLTCLVELLRILHLLQRARVLVNMSLFPSIGIDIPASKCLEHCLPGTIAGGKS